MAHVYVTLVYFKTLPADLYKNNTIETGDESL